MDAPVPWAARVSNVAAFRARRTEPEPAVGGRLLPPRAAWAPELFCARQRGPVPARGAADGEQVRFRRTRDGAAFIKARAHDGHAHARACSRPGILLTLFTAAIVRAAARGLGPGHYFPCAQMAGQTQRRGQQALLWPTLLLKWLSGSGPQLLPAGPVLIVTGASLLVTFPLSIYTYCFPLWLAVTGLPFILRL